MHARKVSEILGEAGELGSIADVSRRVARLQHVYTEAVPPELVDSSRVGWARGGVLCVIADHGAAAAKLRQIPARILRHMQRSGFEFNSMHIEVQVGRALRNNPYRPSKSLSKQALSSIDAALTAMSDSPLKAALARLARRR